MYFLHSILYRKLRIWVHLSSEEELLDSSFFFYCMFSLNSHTITSNMSFNDVSLFKYSSIKGKITNVTSIKKTVNFLGVV